MALANHFTISQIKMYSLLSSFTTDLRNLKLTNTIKKYTIALEQNYTIRLIKEKINLRTFITIFFEEIILKKEHTLKKLKYMSYRKSEIENI